MRIFRSKLFRFLMLPLSGLYRGVIAARNRLYDRGVLPVHRVSARVISVGNISVGGSGKTPVTMAIVRLLQAEGCRVAVLSRGYRRKGEGALLVSRGDGPLCEVTRCGDEPWLMAEQLRGVPVCVAADRVAGAELLIRECSAQVIVLDDGFQHRRLHRDLDIVLVDAGEFLCNSSVLPAGPYREPTSALLRADVLLAADRESGGEEALAALLQKIKLKNNAHAAPVAFSMHAVFDPRTGQSHDLGELAGARVLPVCGLARPQQFTAGLERAGLIVLFPLFFRDHMHYTAKEAALIESRFRTSGAEKLVTTRKDWVKLSRLSVAEKLPIWVVEMRAELDAATVAYLLDWYRRRG